MSLDSRVEAALGDLRPTASASPEKFQCHLGGEPRTLAERMSATRVPGLALAVLDRDGVIFAGGFGKRASALSGITPETPFQVGSISKPVFALGVMRLVEEGVIDLDEDVNAYLKEWRISSGPDWAPRVTLRQLLSHTAGMTVHGFPGYAPGEPTPSVTQVLEGEAPANTPPIVVDVVPGTLQRYSGGGTTIAQKAVVDRTGAPFADLMRQLVLEPVGMLDSSYEQPPQPRLADAAALGHLRNGGPVSGGWHVYPEMAAAGLWTTAADMALLAQALLNTFQGRSSRLPLKPETLTEMLRPQLADQPPESWHIGLGWFCSGRDEELGFGHSGGNEGFIADMRIFPNLGGALVVMTNGLGGFELCLEVESALARARQWPTGLGARRGQANDLSSGVYSDQLGRTAELGAAGGNLTLRLLDHPALVLAPCSTGGWFAEAANVRVRFEPGDDSSDTLVIEQPGKTLRLRSRPES